VRAQVLSRDEPSIEACPALVVVGGRYVGGIVRCSRRPADPHRAGGYGLFGAAEHVFLLGPPLLLPLGLILLRTPVLARPFAWLAVILGVTSPILGLAGLFAVTANNNGPAGAAINALVAAQGPWIIAAGVTLPLRHGGEPRSSRLRKRRAR
jgi:hypothetical protein